MKLVSVQFTKPWGNYAVGNVAGFSAEEAKPLVDGYSYEKGGRKFKVAPVAKKVGTVDTVKAARDRSDNYKKQRLAELEAQKAEIQEQIDLLTGEAEKKPEEKKTPEPPKGDKKPEDGNQNDSKK